MPPPPPRANSTPLLMDLVKNAVLICARFPPVRRPCGAWCCGTKAGQNQNHENPAEPQRNRTYKANCLNVRSWDKIHGRCFLQKRHVDHRMVLPLRELAGPPAIRKSGLVPLEQQVQLTFVLDHQNHLAWEVRARVATRMRRECGVATARHQKAKYRNDGGSPARTLRHRSCPRSAWAATASCLYAQAPGPARRCLPGYRVLG